MRLCYRNSEENEHTKNASQHQDEKEYIYWTLRDEIANRRVK